MSKRLTKSPLKAANLRQPGQSVQEEIDRLWDDELVPALVVVMTFALLFMEWWRYFFNVPSGPLLFVYTVSMVFAIVYFLFRLVVIKATCELSRTGCVFWMNLRSALGSSTHTSPFCGPSIYHPG